MENTPQVDHCGVGSGSVKFDDNSGRLGGGELLAGQAEHRTRGTDQKPALDEQPSLRSQNRGGLFFWLLSRAMRSLPPCLAACLRASPFVLFPKLVCFAFTFLLLQGDVEKCSLAYAVTEGLRSIPLVLGLLARIGKSHATYSSRFRDSHQ